jgi:hypothetical protein
MANGLWKHEEPLELESESETETEAELANQHSLFRVGRKRRRPKSADEKQRIAERLIVRKREREASRPFYQFFYQISRKRERIKDESRSEEGAVAVAVAAHINTTAYNIVKSKWIKGRNMK